MIELLDKRIELEDGFVIKEYYTDYGNVRILYVDDIRQSVTFIDKSKKYSLCDFYFSFYDLPVSLNPNGRDYLVLGGGGFTYPKYYIAKYKDKKMDVVEINGKCVEYAKKFFYLDDLFNRYDFERKRLNIIIQDALVYISECKNKYDYVLVDLFNGKKMVGKIYQEYYLQKLKRMLADNGIIIINYMISDINMYMYKDELQVIVKTTKEYKIITNKLYFDEKRCLGNILILLSDCDINIPDNYDYSDVSYILN